MRSWSCSRQRPSNRRSVLIKKPSSLPCSCPTPAWTAISRNIMLCVLWMRCCRYCMLSSCSGSPAARCTLLGSRDNIKQRRKD